MPELTAFHMANCIVQRTRRLAGRKSPSLSCHAARNGASYAALCATSCAT